MHFTINIQLKVSKNYIRNLKPHFLCNKKKTLKWHFLKNRGSISCVAELSGCQRHLDLGYLFIYK